MQEALGLSPSTAKGKKKKKGKLSLVWNSLGYMYMYVEKLATVYTNYFCDNSVPQTIHSSLKINAFTKQRLPKSVEEKRFLRIKF